MARCWSSENGTRTKNRDAQGTGTRLSRELSTERCLIRAVYPSLATMVSLPAPVSQIILTVSTKMSSAYTLFSRETREKIAKAKNQRALNAKLQGSTLGDAPPEDKDADGESMAAWVKKSKKLQKQRAREIEMARQREAEQEERERAVYGEGECGAGNCVDCADLDS